jgi:hypothetical protein
MAFLDLFRRRRHDEQDEQNEQMMQALLANQVEIKGVNAIASGPFPVANPEGRLLCKSCGVPFDKETIGTACNFYKGVVKPSEFLIIPCRKCDGMTVVLRRDIENEWLWKHSSYSVRVTIDVRGIQITINGPLPTADGQGRLLCRHCGLPYDSAARSAVTRVPMTGKPGSELAVLQCRSCTTVSSFEARHAGL